jgi:hypothetical protein
MRLRNKTSQNTGETLNFQLCLIQKSIELHAKRINPKQAVNHRWPYLEERFSQVLGDEESMTIVIDPGWVSMTSPDIREGFESSFLDQDRLS